jgi:ribonuclease D
VIDTNQKLAAFLSQLRSVDWIALDTEADSLHAYPEKLCLIQVSVAGWDELLDPLANLDLRPALDELHRHELIMHGADYDLRLLRRHCHFTPTAIFDTMIAARLLGGRQFGLDSLVLGHLGFKLEKGPQKANWAKRPLTPRMDEYARNDTRHLKPLADILRAELRGKGRLSWHQESCARLIVEATPLPNPDPNLQWRVKGSARLSPGGLAVLRELWHWREQEAVAANKPPYFILQPEKMIELASAAVNGHSLDHAIPRHLTPRRRDGVLDAVERGLAARSLPQPLRSRGHRHTETEKKRFQELERRRNHHANHLGLDPSLIASRSTLVQLAQNWDKHQVELMSWQRELLTP